MSDIRSTLNMRYAAMELGLILAFISAVGVAEPELGAPCEEALAALTAQQLQIVDVDLLDNGVLYTMAKGSTPTFRFLHRLQPTAKVALVECQSAAAEL
jgi:hypothetical protein